MLVSLLNALSDYFPFNPIVEYNKINPIVYKRNEKRAGAKLGYST